MTALTGSYGSLRPRTSHPAKFPKYVLAHLELAVQAVVDGALWAEPPLSGQVEPWRTSLVRTAAHARGEEHAP